MNEESRLVEKLRRIEALFAGTTELGERIAAANALERLLAKLEEIRETDQPIEYRFSIHSPWSRKLFCALLRRYGIEPYNCYRESIFDDDSEASVKDAPQLKPGG